MTGTLANIKTTQNPELSVLAFRSRELGLPTFQTTSHESKIASITAVKSDRHTFMPYYSIHLIFKRAWQHDELRSLCDAIYAEFGPVPFSSIDGRTGISFAMRLFDDPVFINKLAELLQKRQLVSNQDKVALIKFFENNHDKIKNHLQAEKDCHIVPEEKIRLHKLIKDKNATLADVEELLKDTNVDVNYQDGYGRTALLVATKATRTDIVQLLLEHGADPHIHDWFGDRPLENASYGNRLEIAKLLLEHRADPNLFWCNSAMHHAFAMASDEMVALLTHHGARCDLLNMFGETAVNQSINARHHDHGETVRRRAQIASRLDLLTTTTTTTPTTTPTPTPTPTTTTTPAPVTVAKAVVKIQTPPLTLSQKIHALSEAIMSDVIHDSDLENLSNLMRSIDITSTRLSQDEYNIWFQSCLLLPDQHKAAVNQIKGQINIDNITHMKQALLIWMKNLDRKSAIRACEMACNQKTLLGQLLHTKCGWFAPSMKRGTLKQVNDHLQLLLEQERKIAAEPKPQAKLESKPAPVVMLEKRDEESSEHVDVYPVIAASTATMNPIERVEAELASLTKTDLYPDASTSQKLEETLPIINNKLARIDTLRSEEAALKRNVNVLLFDCMPANLPLPLQPTVVGKLPTPLQPNKLNLVATPESEMQALADDRDKEIEKMLDALPSVPKHSLFHHELTNPDKSDKDKSKATIQKSAVAMQLY